MTVWNTGTLSSYAAGGQSTAWAWNEVWSGLALCTSYQPSAHL